MLPSDCTGDDGIGNVGGSDGGGGGDHNDAHNYRHEGIVDSHTYT